ncbi:hypothetical protein [Azospirillum brasilense]|uniref:Uncharacterized protein n=1 Tax=Azospirillum brasilense TaxID=192 RepID=A0A6L3ARF6_AZOBR|nr:hypothetical protein [Azospirillum brasilense]KAA0676741.1 hypothetical protein DS837_30390 [Azospirillum brasilense]
MAELHRWERVAVCILSADMRDQSDAIFEELKNDLLEFVSLRPSHRSGDRLFRADANSEWHIKEFKDWREAVEYTGILLGPDDPLVTKIAHHPDLAASAPRTTDQALRAWSVGYASDGEALAVTGLKSIEDLCIATYDADLQPPAGVVERVVRELEARAEILRRELPEPTRLLTETTDAVAAGMVSAGCPVEEVLAELILDGMTLLRWRAMSRVRVDGKPIFDASNGPEALEIWVAAEVVAAARTATRADDPLDEASVQAAVARGLRIAFRADEADVQASRNRGLRVAYRRDEI